MVSLDYAEAAKITTLMDMPHNMAMLSGPVIATQNFPNHERKPSRNSSRSDKQPRGRFKHRGRALNALNVRTTTRANV